MKTLDVAQDVAKKDTHQKKNILVKSLFAVRFANLITTHVAASVVPSVEGNKKIALISDNISYLKVVSWNMNGNLRDKLPILKSLLKTMT